MPDAFDRSTNDLKPHAATVKRRGRAGLAYNTRLHARNRKPSGIATRQHEAKENDEEEERTPALALRHSSGHLTHYAHVVGVTGGIGG